MTSRADIIGGPAASAEPAALDRAARDLRDRADLARSTRTRIEGASPAGWKGKGSDAFRAQQNGPIPHKLGAVAQALEHGSETLRSYARGLEHVQQRADDLARRKDAAQRAVEHATREAAAAGRALTAEKRSAAYASDPASVTIASKRVARASAAAGRAAGAVLASGRDLAAIEVETHTLRNELRSIGTRHGTDLHHAVGSQPAPKSAFGSAVAGAIGFWAAKADPARSAPKFIEKTFRDLLKKGSTGGRPRTPGNPWWSRKGLEQRYQQAARTTNTWWKGVEKKTQRLAAKGSHALGRGHKLLGGTTKIVGQAPKVIRKVPIVGSGIAVWDATQEAKRGDWRGAGTKLGMALGGVVTGGSDLLTGGMLGDIFSEGLEKTSEKAANGEYGPHMFFLTESDRSPIKWTGDKIADGLWTMWGLD